MPIRQNILLLYDREKLLTYKELYDGIAVAARYLFGNTDKAAARNFRAAAINLWVNYHNKCNG